MILFYGTGGVPGGGEIPMDPIRYRASDDFLFCIRHQEGVDLLPSNIELSGMETGLFNRLLDFLHKKHGGELGADLG